METGALTVREKISWSLIALAVGVQIALGWAPVTDRFTWALENVPVWIGLAVYAVTWRKFPLSLLLVTFLVAHSVILAVGGHWSYAEVPAGRWFQQAMGWQRNPYDRLGHLAQGFVPALFVRELLLRTTPLGRGGWVQFLSGAVAVAFSALYEMIEWWVALFSEQAADAFLGTQGDNWDTQWDMAMALTGAVLSLTFLSRWHDRSIRKLAEPV